jgi:co-chaperonin GroES (HSP10)
MQNNSGLKPLGRAVLVEPYEPETRKSLIVIPENVRERTAAVEQRAVIVEVGPEAWAEEQSPRALPGDRVIVSKYAGWMAVGPLDGRLYRFVNCNDIFAGITAESQQLAQEAS